jgi:hypothetical protein
MAASQRRPRDKGGTDAKDSAAKSFETSNQTMTMFLGGTQKSWMTGGQLAKDLQTSSPQTPTHPNPILQGTAIQARTGGSGPQVADDGAAGGARHGSAPIAISGASSLNSVGAGAGAGATAATPTLKSPLENLDTVLPSPAPSDEPRQASVHIIDLEEDEPEPPAKDKTGNAPGEALNENQLNELAASYGGVEEIEEQLGSAEPHSVLPDAANNMELVASSRDAESLMESRPPGQQQAQSSNSIPQESLVPSERPLQPRPPLMNSGSNIVPGLATRIPSTVVVAAFRTQITYRMEAIRSTDHMRRTIEIPRLGLLEDACMVYDYFYLIIHQLFCVATVPSLTQPSSLNGQEFADGLVLLTHLLLPNDQLPLDAATWFSTFPLPVNAILEHWPGLKPAHDKVLQCLLKLPREWLNLIARCHQRFFPPLVDEMIRMLGVESVVLQRVICRAVVRDIWAGSQDECYNEVERLFNQNQQEVFLRESLNGTPQAATAEAIEYYNQHLALKYQYVWARHRSHLGRELQQADLVQPHQMVLSTFQTPMPPPQQVNRNPNTPMNATVYHNIAQSMYPAPVSRRPASLTIDTQSVSQTPRNFATPQVTPSPLFSGAQSAPATTVATSPASRNSPASGVFRASAFGHDRGRGRPRRDFAVSVAHNPGPRSAIGSGNSIHMMNRSADSMSPQVAANSPRQHFFGRQWEHQPVQFGLLQPHVLSPAAPRLGHIVAPSPNTQNISQPRRASIPLHTENQTRSPLTPNNPSTSNHSYRTQPMLHQSQPVQILPSEPPQPSRPLFPPSGYVRSFRDPPNPLPATLHQAQVRSPDLSTVNTEGKADNGVTYFTFVRRVVLMPKRLSQVNRHFSWTFEVDKESSQLLAESSDGLGGAPPLRIVNVGSRTCRIRCIKVSTSNEIGESDWVVAETFWPNGIAILLSGIALELRKKLHHGKDIPADITKYIKEGANRFSVAITRLDPNDASTYAVGIEIIETTDLNHIRAEIPKLDAVDALKRIAERSASFDPDIEIVNSAVIVDITDPFTSCIFELPVRGKTCRHNQCFDLNVFLQTRGSKAGHPCAPEQFKCPICGSDARPQMLLVDMFFVKIREDLQRMDRLDAKAITLDDQSTWQIKEEETNGESGDGTGKQALPECKHSEVRWPKVSEGRDNEIIELDDD